MIELIPAIDIIDGKCVRLTKGDYDQKTVYNDDPVSVAKHFEELGAKRLHMVDLDGARSKHVVNIEVLRAVKEKTKLIVDFGGGIKTEEDIEKVLNGGADMVTIGSIAVTEPELFNTWLSRYGAERIILGADAKNSMISINGWKEERGEQLQDFLARYIAMGVKNVLCTDISKDGMLQGPAIDLYRGIIEAHPSMHLIASGGVSCMEDIKKLEEAGIPAVVFGKAIYEGRINMTELFGNRV